MAGSRRDAAEAARSSMVGSSRGIAPVPLSPAGSREADQVGKTDGERSDRRYRWYAAVVTLAALALLLVRAASALPSPTDNPARPPPPRPRNDDGFEGEGHSSWREISKRRKLSSDVSTKDRLQARKATAATVGHRLRPRNPDDANQRWKGAGGEYGLASDWRVALRDGRDVRRESCLTHARQEEVRQILERRRAAGPTRKKVAACLRTKDNGRYLPEWIAFHYAAGVDEFSIYDDNSADNTPEVLQPFIDAGIVRYFFELIHRRTSEMKPLNHCLGRYKEEKEGGDADAPSWLLFHDSDEYLYPEDTSLTILEALEKHNDTCCSLVPRVQYGTSGYDEMPRGLIHEVFLTHGLLRKQKTNPKVMVNLDPTDKDHPVRPFLRSMHKALGCKCARQELSGMRINHYLGSRGDYLDRLSRYWTDVLQGNMSADNRLNQRDQNEARTDVITHWACATREILYRVEKGLDLETGSTIPAARGAPCALTC